MRGRRRGRHRSGGFWPWGRPVGGSADTEQTVSGGAPRAGRAPKSSSSGLRIVLWDTRRGGVFKDFAGGFGVGPFRGQGLRGKIIEHFYRRDYRAPSLAYGYLAGGLGNLGHMVEYCIDETPAADLFIFNPALMTLAHEIEVMRRLKARQPATQIVVCGQVAGTMPEAFSDVECCLVSGEPEQIAARLDEVLAAGNRRLDLGTIADLDSLPFPDWSIFPYWRFKVGYDFWKFPTAYVQSSRGCTLSCSYCPYIILENKVRIRSPAIVAEEIRRDMEEYGFESFKFRDPLFGARRKHVEGLAEEIGRLPRKIQFSVESRIELLPREVLEMLRDVGLVSVTVGIETPSRETLLKYKRAPIRDDKQEQFVALCRSLGIRVVAGFMIGFPDDTRESIREVFRYARQLNPFAANFNICTPYPGTGFLDEIAPQVASRDWSRYDVYTANIVYEHLTPQELAELHAQCFRHYYFRWEYLAENWQFLLPRWHRLVSLFSPQRSGGETIALKAAGAGNPAPPQERVLPALPVLEPPAAASGGGRKRKSA